MTVRRLVGGRAALRRCGALLVVAGLLVGLLVGLLAAAAGAHGDGTLVDVVEVEGTIDRTVVGYLRDAVATAEADGAEVLVVQLDSPGGLGVPVAELVELITTSRVPVAVWVGPSGSQAASAGTYVAYAAHVLAVAPATTIGAATPVDLGDGNVSPDERNAAEAQLVALAELRGRNVDFARAAVRDGAVVAVGETAALPPNAQLPPRIDRGDVELLSAAAVADRRVVEFVATDIFDVVAALDGREVTMTTADGTSGPRTLHVDAEDANVRFNNLGLVRRALHTVANPTLAYLLLVVGALALLFEVFQPGFGVAGVSGLVLLGLGLYGLSVLPVSWLAFGLVVAGLALLAADLAIARLGLLTAGGTVALTVGSLLLFPGPAPLRLSPWLVAGVVAFTVVFFVVIMTTVLRAQGNQALAGAEGIAGKVGVVRSMLNPEGHVFVDGALWRARAPEAAGKVRTGTRVRILGVNDRLTLDVELVDSGDTTAVG